MHNHTLVTINDKEDGSRSGGMMGLSSWDSHLKLKKLAQQKCAANKNPHGQLLNYK
jgi:hypothetical protein